jgi:hypothetical protein
MFPSICAVRFPVLTRSGPCVGSGMLCAHNESGKQRGVLLGP